MDKNKQWAAIRRDTDEPTYTIKYLTVEEEAALESMGLAIKQFQTRDMARAYARNQRNSYDGSRRDCFRRGMDWQYRSFKRVVPAAVQQYEMIGDDVLDQ